MSPKLAAAFQILPNCLGQHVLLSAASLLLGLLLSLPLAVAASRRPRLRWAALTLAGLVQTIPSLALLALFYPLLLGLSALAKAAFGQGFSALGFLPALLALTLYAMLPILRNTVAGLAGIEPAVIEAARGVGMTERQKLFQVELPLAAPVIMAGVRTAAVWTIGAATLATPVGQTSLGDYIFSGLQTEDWALVLFGCASAAVLALVVDQLLGLIESGVAARSRGRIAAGAGGLVLGVAAALAPMALAGDTATPVVIGAKNFSEQYILADLIADRLARAGYRVSQKNDLGSAVAYRAVASGGVDAYVDYSGTLWANVLGRTDNPPRAVLLDQLGQALKRRDEVTTLGALGFENAYALAMRRDRAQALGIRTLADLSAHAPDLVLGSDLEFLSRPEWTALQRAYGLKFKTERRYQPTFMYRAISGGDVDVISAFSSDGRIAADDLVVLTDPRQAIPPYDAVILVSPQRARDARFTAALKPLVGAIPVEAMRAANLSVDREQDKRTPAEAARALAAHIGH
ncbi:ABC transporter permease/substrate-binding protein [Phenylobacterium montanum]|uniref:ABC transporter permease/substrate-binding protein n=1 Tax=Phenylobacterium montanum TaxID=2823693 RepID=A0A975FZS0_9CAUL|nr:ABC transporter permease/substrate-binding protein [Caulobacter sp. S6]QUD87837.1 ABC transporter permease/substrate-binding protein [Caulobacter sp. S6]